MISLTSIVSISDAQLKRMLSDDEIQKRHGEFYKRATSSGDVHGSLQNAQGSIDAKATAVLQHVSIMIAVTTLLFSQTSGLVKSAFGLEMLIYVILALLCLRVLMPQQLSPHFNEFQDLGAKEALFDMASKSAYVVTVILIVTVIFEMLLK